MPNPYHDETGQFCSKDQMRSAIERAGREGKLEVYFQLRKDFEDIEKDRVSVSTATIQNLFGQPTLLGKAKTSEEVTAIYKAVLPQFSSEKNKDFVATTVRYFLDNPLTDEAVKSDMIANLDADSKTALLEGHRNHGKRLGEENVYAHGLLKGDTNESFVAEVASSDLYTFEDKYTLAKQHPNGIATLAANSPETFYSVDELREELAEAYKTKEQDGADLSAFHQAFAVSPYEKDQMIAAEVYSPYDMSYNTTGYMLVHNRDLHPRVGRVIIARTMERDISALGAVNADLMNNFKYSKDSKKQQVARNLKQVADMEKIKPFDREFSPEMQMTLAKIDVLEAEKNPTIHEMRELDSLYAIQNSHVQGYLKLQSDLKDAEREYKRSKRSGSTSDRVMDLRQKLYYANTAIKGAYLMAMLNEK